MKKIIFPTIILLFMIGNCTVQKSSFPQGAWRLVDRMTVNGNSVIHDIPAGENIKMWSDNRFIFVGKYKNDSTVLDSYGEGLYRLTNNHYEENINIHFYKGMVGKKIKMLLDMRKDTLIQTYPVDDNWQTTITPYYVEKFVKIR